MCVNSLDCAKKESLLDQFGQLVHGFKFVSNCPIRCLTSLLFLAQTIKGLIIFRVSTAVYYLFVMFVAAASVDDVFANDQETLRQIDDGRVLGFSNARGANVWRGIRYAAVPTGRSR